MTKKYLWLMFFLVIRLSARAEEKLSLSLQDAKLIALKNNPDYQMQLTKIDLQKGLYWQELMPENPEIGIEAEEVPKGLSYNNYGEKKLFVSQSIEFPTNYFFRHNMLSAEIEQARARLEELQRELFFNVEQAYWNLVLRNELLALAQQNLELSQDFFEKSKQSYELGESDRLTMLKAKVNFGSAQQNLVAIAKYLEAGMAHLRRTLGKKTISVVATDSLAEKINIVSVENLKETLSSHPALKAALLSQKALANAKRLAYSSFLPQVSISYFKQEIDQSDFWGGEIGLSIPLWFMKQKGLIQQVKAEQRMADYFYVSEQLRLDQEFDQASAQYEKASSEVKFFQTDLLNEAEEVFRIAQQSYVAGEIGYLDFIDAQKTLIQTRENYLQSLFNYHIEKARLMKLTGIDL